MDEVYHSFTIRCPVATYAAILELAQAEGVPLNRISNRLIELGLGRQVDITNLLRSMVEKLSVEETT